MEPTASNGSVVEVLSWLMPLAGVLLWIFVLPSTRAAIQGRFRRRPSRSSTTDEPTRASTDPASTAAATPRRREEDPEIVRFDHAVVVSKVPAPIAVPARSNRTEQRE